MSILNGWNFWWKLIYLMAAIFTVYAVIRMIVHVIKNYRSDIFWWFVDKESTRRIRLSNLKRALYDDEHLDVPPSWVNRHLYRETVLEPITINTIIFERNKTNG